MVRGKPDNRLVDLTGKRFSRLVVLGRCEGDVGSRHPKWKCLCVCGNRTFVRGGFLKNGHTTSCGCVQKSTLLTGTERGSANPSWKGGRNYTSQGYVRLRNVYGHPNADCKGRVAEHIKVMSDFLGRALDTRKESVHHKNGVRDDNRIENLELRVRWHGLGHSVPDAVQHAVEILRRHAPELLSDRGCLTAGQILF